MFIIYVLIMYMYYCHDCVYVFYHILFDIYYIDACNK